MKNTLLTITISMNLLLVITATYITFMGHFIAGPCMVLFAIHIIESCLKDYQYKVKQFSLVELIAVIAIMAVLLSITLTFKPDTMKSDALRVKDLLMQAKIYSYDVDHVVPVNLDANFKNDIISNSDIFFLKGSPVNEDTSILLDCSVKVKDSQNKVKPYIIRVNSFTGKIMYITVE